MTPKAGFRIVLIFLLVISANPPSFANPDFMGDPTEAPVPVEEPSDPEETPVEEMPADPMPPQPEDMDAALFAATPEENSEPASPEDPAPPLPEDMEAALAVTPDPETSPSPSPSPNPSSSPYYTTVVKTYSITSTVLLPGQPELTNETYYEKKVDVDQDGYESGVVYYDRITSSTIHEAYSDDDDFEGLKKTYTAYVYADESNTPADTYEEITIDAFRTDETDETLWAFDAPHVFGDYHLTYTNGNLINASGTKYIQTKRSFLNLILNDGSRIVDQIEEKIKFDSTAGAYNWITVVEEVTVAASEGAMNGYKTTTTNYDDDENQTSEHVETYLKSIPGPDGIWHEKNTEYQDGVLTYYFHWRHHNYIQTTSGVNYFYDDIYSIDENGNETFFMTENNGPADAA